MVQSLPETQVVPHSRGLGPCWSLRSSGYPSVPTSSRRSSSSPVELGGVCREVDDTSGGKTYSQRHQVVNYAASDGSDSHFRKSFVHGRPVTSTWWHYRWPQPARPWVSRLKAWPAETSPSWSQIFEPNCPRPVGKVGWSMEVDDGTCLLLIKGSVTIINH